MMPKIVAVVGAFTMILGCHREFEVPRLYPQDSLLEDPGTEESHACRVSCQEEEARCVAQGKMSFENCRRQGGNCIWLCPGVTSITYKDIHATMTVVAKTPTMPPASGPLPPSVLRP